MISITVNKICKDDPSLIENYDKAISDTTQTWICHHRLEIELNVSADELKNMGRYFNVPANELIFLTNREHTRLHRPGIYQSEESKRKISDAHKGKHHSEETKKKMSEKSKGPNNPMYGKSPSEATRKLISDALKGPNNPMYGKSAPWNAHPKSEETKQRMRAAALRRWHPELYK